MTTRVLVFVAALLASANTSLAQQKEPIGRFVADLRAASTGLPTAAGWTPVVPSGTVVPSRGLALDAGAHFYILRFGRNALGVGATWLTGRSTSSTPVVTTDTPTPSPSATFPDVTTRITMLTPQLSLNFGHSMGWSYLSAGLGRARVESEATATSGTATFAPRDSSWVKALNYGGGARWFLSDHLGVGFDLRWHKLSIVPGSDTHPGAPRASLIVAGGGIVLK
jgi:opacity protein-like surface antigen